MESDRVFNRAVAHPGRSLKYWPAWMVAAVLVLPVLVWLFTTGAFSHLLLTGHLFPIDRMERLNAPMLVAGWSEEGIRLVDGQTVPLPGVKRLPATSKVLDAVLSQGVEVASDGRVYGLVRIHHGCGNDPVRNHVAKVDVGHLLVYLREAEPERSLPDDVLTHDGFAYSEHGWNISQHVGFTAFEDILAQWGTQPQTAPASR